MKILVKLMLLASLLYGSNLFAASITLAWQDTQNPSNSVTYTLYRAPQACAQNPQFTPVQAGIVPKTYVDAGLAVGRYCYQVTAVDNATQLESLPSNQVDVKNIPLTPTNLVQQ